MRYSHSCLHSEHFVFKVRIPMIRLAIVMGDVTKDWIRDHHGMLNYGALYRKTCTPTVLVMIWVMVR